MNRRWLGTSAIALATSFLLGNVVADDDDASGDDFLYECLIGAYHVRENEDFWGSDNQTHFRFSPTFSFGNVVFESDFTYGTSKVWFSRNRDRIVNVLQSRWATGDYIQSTATLGGVENQNIASYMNDAVRSEAEKTAVNSLYAKKTFIDKARNELIGKMANRQRFYRNYTRATYENRAKNIKVVIGDAPANVTFGGVQGPSGAGIAIYRASGMFDKSAMTLNSQSCIAILRTSFVEILQNGQTIQGGLFAPGVYSLSDLAPEVNLHNIEVQITDDFNHKTKYKVDVHADKRPIAENTDEFEIRAFVPHRFDYLDPFVRKYSNVWAVSGVYRYGYSKDLTLQCAAQAYTGGVKAETGYSLLGGYGLLSQSIGASFANDSNSRNAMSARIFYAPPALPIGTFSFNFGIVGKGYMDLGNGEDQNDMCAKIWKLFSGRTDDYESPYKESTTKNFTIKYTPCQIFKDVGISLFYKQFWEEHHTRYSYDLSFTWTIAKKYIFVSGIGITYDNDGRDLPKEVKSIDMQRRFYVAVEIPVCDQVKLCSSYDYDDDRTWYNSLEYKPKQIPGLTLELTSTMHEGYGDWRAHGGKVKYECKYGDFRFDHNITMRHKPGVHKNRERIYINTYLKNGEFSKRIKNSFFISKSKDELRMKKKAR